MRGLTAFFGVSSLILGCTASSDAPDAQDAMRVEQALAVLTRMTDADSLAAAGLLSLDEHRDQSVSLIARATAAAPERADLLWLQSQVCLKVAPCDPEPFERRLRDLDPSNGVGWMGALARANASKNDEATDAAIAAIGRSDRLDIYWTTLIARLTRATVRTKAIGIQDAEVSIVGYLAAQAIPGYTAASIACKGERLQRAGAIAICQGVAKSFQRGDNYLTEMIGVAIAKRVWPEDSPEWKAAAEARRVYEYRSKLGEKLDLWASGHAEEYLALCAENRREQDVLRAELIKAGENPNPPRE
jgi:hypothetical protein